MTLRVAIGQIRSIDEPLSTYARQLGISSMQVNTPDIPDAGGRWDEDDLRRLREHCEALGLHLEAIENVPYHFYDQVMTGGPGADQQLANLCRTIEAMGRAGVFTLGYHFMPSFVWRTRLDGQGRHGAAVTEFDLKDVPSGNRVPAAQADIAVALDVEDLWACYQRFCEMVLPVAAESGVRLALHPDDPPVPALGRSARLFHDPAQFHRAHDMAAGNPAWGLDLCLGSISEMPGGALAVEEMVRHFGPLGRIFYVHLRDVRGTVPRFSECFLGEGNYDPLHVVRLLHSVGFDGFFLDDHVPHISGDSDFGHIAHAHATGYIQALIHAVTSQSPQDVEEAGRDA